jgi:hypothetical protein
MTKYYRSRFGVLQVDGPGRFMWCPKQPKTPGRWWYPGAWWFNWRRGFGLNEGGIPNFVLTRRFLYWKLVRTR